MNMKLLISISLMVITWNVYGQLSWNELSSIPALGTHGGISFELDDKIYVGLGEQEDGSYSDEIFEYNPSKDEWSKKNLFNGGALFGATSFKIKDEVFICCGNTKTDMISTTNLLYKYDKNNDRWLKMANFPAGGRFFATAFVLDTVAYFGCGSGNNSIWEKDLWKYDPATNEWAQLNNVPFSSSITVNSFVLNGTAYLGNRTDGSPDASNRYWKYDAGNDLWMPTATLPGNKRTRVSSFIYNGMAYVGLGTNFENSDEQIIYNNFYAYDGVGDSWQSTSTETNVPPREYAQIIQLSENEIFLFGGSGVDTVYKDLWKLDISSLGTQNIFLNRKIDVFPNPSSDILIIKFPSTENISSYSIEVYNSNGALVYSKNKVSYLNRISTNKLGATGSYFVNIKNKADLISTQKVIVTK